MNTEITDIKSTNACVCVECSRRSILARFPAGALGGVPALLPIALAVSLGRALPAWVRMWIIALALFFGAKWITIIRFVRSGNVASPVRLLAFAFLWPGMDARAFCGSALASPPRLREWAGAGVKTFVGAGLVWIGAALTQQMHPLVTGWVGMLGLVLLLHFGLFHLLSLIWRALGFDARPIMHSPATATSLSGFWGRAWNVAFSALVHETVFKPLNRQLGARAALLVVFAISGTLHELVLSVPASAGYGLPTAYFLLQGLALLFERSKLGRKLALGSGFRGWCFVALAAGVPAFWLFHPVFIHRVVLPMLHAISAT